MPLKKLGAPPFLVADEVEQDDLVEIIDKPFIAPAEQSRYGKARGKACVKLVRTGEVRMWTMNTTTWDRLVDAFGVEPEMWLNKKVLIKKEQRNISGVEKTVLFGKPYQNPQQPLAPSTIDVKKLTPEQKKALRQALKE